MILLFLTSGLFLGWSLGANDAANVFGTAVATRMVRFRTAAIICGVFVILGAVISGAGASHTLGRLGAVNALAGSFMAALAAALAVFWMTKVRLPVSTSQAIIGAILGWNLFTGTVTDYGSLARIVSTWVLCPLLAAAFAALFFLLARAIVARARLHILRLDSLTRMGLLAAGAFGAYALGANNIANVMGVFVPAVSFRSVSLFGPLQLSSEQLLFLIGAVAIAVGVFSYSYRVMATVGKDLFKLTPITALVVVAAEAVVLFLFASETLENWLLTHGLPSIPLVPVSSSQAVIGAVIGIALAKGGRGVRYGVLRRIAGGWVLTPVIAALVCFIGLFFLQNVFSLNVHRPVWFTLSEESIERLAGEGIVDAELGELTATRFETAADLKRSLEENTNLNGDRISRVLYYSEVDWFAIDPSWLEELDAGALTTKQAEALTALEGQTYESKWALHEALVSASEEWAYLPPDRRNHLNNKRLETRLRYVYDAFRVPSGGVGGD